jgi:hypothetical protein
MLGNKKVFVDTCIVIEYLKGNITLNKKVCYINNIVLMELYIGAKNKRELISLKKQLFGLNLLETNQRVINLSTQIIENYALSHGAKIQDAIIASTCLINDIPIYTFNVKDFRYIEGLEILEKRKNDQ